MVEIIQRKRDGLKLTKEDFDTIVEGIITKKIPDYQLSAFLMAVYFQGLDAEETTFLTKAMMLSGDLIDLSSLPGIKVDKHSTGGVGDKTTLVLTPLVAATGALVAKMSGRGLGHTGGTLDKLESIPGYQIEMERHDFLIHVKEHGIAVIGQNAQLVPADKKLYALRDVTATVNEVSLIAASIMSKKLATGSDAIVIDLKVGKGAFMKTIEQARTLGNLMIKIGNNMDRKVIAVITNMNQPLGLAVGNALEVQEAVDTLRGHGPQDLTDLCIELGSQMIVCAGVVQNDTEGKLLLKELISSGKAIAKFKEWIEAQGGETIFLDKPHTLNECDFSLEVKAGKAGYISKLDALSVGLASMKLGAGRETKEDTIDYGAGILLKKKIGDYVEEGDVLAMLFTNDKRSFEEATSLFNEGVKISNSQPILEPLIFEVLV